jgi:phage baseplate assembly protein W
MNSYLKYPFNIQKNSELKKIDDSFQFHDQNIRLFFMTPKGARILRNNFGSSIQRYFGIPKTIESASIIQNVIINELNENFPKIIISEVTVAPDGENFLINIKYNLRNEINPLFFRELNFQIQ